IPLSEELRSRAEGFAPPRKKRVPKAENTEKGKKKSKGRKMKNQDTSDNSEEESRTRADAPEYLDVVPSSSSDDEDVFERMRRQRDEINKSNNTATDASGHTNTHKDINTVKDNSTNKGKDNQGASVDSEESEMDVELRRTLREVWHKHAEAVQWLKGGWF
ncbi:hypothetical protein SARC_16154, partial [Sphaeroforma arctica JP610]